MNKWKNYGLWTALASALILAVQAIGSLFGFEVAPEKYDQVMAVVNTVLGVLVVLGVVSNPSSGNGFKDKDGV